MAIDIDNEYFYHEKYSRDRIRKRLHQMDILGLEYDNTNGTFHFPWKKERGLYISEVGYYEDEDFDSFFNRMCEQKNNLNTES